MLMHSTVDNQPWATGERGRRLGVEGGQFETESAYTLFSDTFEGLSESSAMSVTRQCGPAGVADSRRPLFKGTAFGIIGLFAFLLFLCG